MGGPVALVGFEPTPQSQRDRFVLAAIPTVRRMARRFYRSNMVETSVEDLTQSGLLGLLDAYTRWDQSSDTSLIAFATQRIYGSMKDSLRINDPISRIDRHHSSVFNAASERMAIKLKRKPRREEIAREINMALPQLDELLVTVTAAEMSYNVMPDGKSHHAVSRDPDAEEILLGNEQRAEILRVLPKLKYRSRTILTMYYLEQRSQPEIGKHLGLSSPRISQLLPQALAELIKALDDHRLPKFYYVELT